MVINRFGGPEVLEEQDVERPEPSAGDVLIRVICSGTNPVDAKLRQNAGWAGLEPPIVLGYDVSGIVEAVGADVAEFEPGDEVYSSPEIFGNRFGSYAEYTAVPADILARKPRNLSHEEAASVPLAGGTAWEAIVRRIRIMPGETILIHGGAGGVGSFAVQIAKAAGARVLASASTANQAVMRELGADVTIDYTSEDAAEIALEETGGEGVDAVFDTAGGDLISKSIRATRSFGRMACILTPQGSMGGVASKNQTLYGVFLMREAKRLKEMAKAIEQGTIKPFVKEVLPLSEVGKAHERLDSGHGAGKVVLRISNG